MTESTSESTVDRLVRLLDEETQVTEELADQLGEALSRHAEALILAEQFKRVIEDQRDRIDDLTNWLEREQEAGKSKDRVISAGSLDRNKLVDELAALEKELAEYKADYADLRAEVMDKRDRLDRLAQYETPSPRIDEHLGLNWLKVGDPSASTLRVGDLVTVTEPYEGLGGVFDDWKTVHPGDGGTVLELDLYTSGGVEAAHIHWDNESGADLPPLSVLKKVEG